MAKKVDADIRALVKISREVGSDDRLVQAGGGNTSVKSADGKRMLIKASGTGLRAMSPERGYVTMAMKPLLALLADQRVAAMSDAKREPLVLETMYRAVTGGPDPSARPSCEATLHAMLQRYVVHIHPIAVIGILTGRESEKVCKDLARRGKFTMVWIPYTNPGHPLAVACRDAVDAFKAAHDGAAPDALLLENHGLFVSATSAARSVKLTKDIVALCEKMYAARRKKSVAKVRTIDDEAALDTVVELRRALVEQQCDARLVKAVPDAMAVRLMARKDARTILHMNNTPDTLVYCLAYPMMLPKASKGKVADAVARYIKAHGEPPRVVLVPGYGFLAVADSEKAIETTVVVYRAQLEFLERSFVFGGPKLFRKAEADYINSWEVETHRRKVARAEAGEPGPLSGKVAIVTGAGSGLGRGIAMGLAAAGAHVMLADIDMAAAEETAGMVAEHCNTPRATAVKADVTCEESMAEAFRTTARTYGGIDVVVAAAGIAPAFPIQDFPVEAFNLTLAVNLTGYFLAGREAARWMIRQKTGGSLIFISSKSGLDASKNNAAYNATKAGELHLMRGLALELGQHGIRSNAICPGNVFEGSKIWNPKYIAQAAKKRGLRPDEVIPHYISLTSLGMEIKQEDIAGAAVFLASDQSRVISGQSLVVDAGQVFVR
jgi:NAD(P)-dependent dehydrogenase (short-subunit alcohol dehydrogenase family)/rhamnose utilization protein RhaD (predicted bifunctional aldolase and dehydrogenase)